MREVQTKSNLLTPFVLAAIAAILAVGIYLGLQKADKYLELKARADCSTVSRHQISIPTDNVVVYYPIEDMYKKCLDEKGY